jgi:CRP/FNR family transcriptional regulator, cyclic AMP receptor protein
MDGARIDLRSLPVWERPAKVADLFDTLPPGGSLTLLTENEPRGLAFRLEQQLAQAAIVDHKRIGGREWMIRITRASAEPEASSPLGVITRTSIFSALSSEERALLASFATPHTIRRGQTLVNDEAVWPYIGIAFEGVLALASGNGNGRPRIFQEYFPYELFGELELFDEAPSAGRVIALSKVSRYLRIPRRAVVEAGERCPQVLVALGRLQSQRRRDLMETLAAQATLPIIARIANVLVPYAMPERGLSAARPPLPNMTQAQIAAAAGTVKEVAARAIAELEGRELLRRERGHIRYLDRQRLLDLIKDAR